MSIKAGELWIELGVKGADKTLAAFTSIKGGLNDTKEMSLEAKAGILGVFYGIEQLFSASMKAGTALMNMNAYLGTNSKAMQQWGEAAKLGGSSVASVFGAAGSIQKIMTAWKNNQAAPPMLGPALAGMGVSAEELKSHSGDLPWIMDKLRLLSQSKGMDKGRQNDILAKWGLDPTLIGAMRNGQLDPKKLSQIPILSNGEQRSLAGIDQAFGRMELQWQKGFAKMLAQNPGLPRDLEKLSTSLLHLAEALNQLVKSTHILDLLTKVLEILGYATGKETGAIDSINKMFDPKTRAKGTEEFFKLMNTYSNPVNAINNTLAPQITNIIQIGKDVGKELINQIEGAAARGTVQGINKARTQSQKQAN